MFGEKKVENLTLHILEMLGVHRKKRSPAQENNNCTTSEQVYMLSNISVLTQLGSYSE